MTTLIHMKRNNFLELNEIAHEQGEEMLMSTRNENLNNFFFTNWNITAFIKLARNFDIDRHLHNEISAINNFFEASNILAKQKGYHKDGLPCQNPARRREQTTWQLIKFLSTNYLFLKEPIKFQIFYLIKFYNYFDKYLSLKASHLRYTFFFLLI